MRMRNKLAAAAVAAVCVLHTSIWFLATNEAATQVARWADAQRARGWSVTYNEAGRAGWPWAALTRITDLRLGGPVAMTADAATAGVSLLQPQQAVLRFESALHLTMGGLPALTLQAERLEARLPLDHGPNPDHADLDAAMLQITSGGTAWLAVRQAHVQASLPQAGSGRFPSLAFTLQAGPATLPDPLPPEAPAALSALGPTIRRLDIAGTLDLPSLQPAGPSATATAWRDAGGTLRLSLAAFEWGALHASGQATMTLDPSLQPTGQARLRLSGFTETLNALTAGHAIPPRTATAAGAVLALLARPAADGTLEVEAPLTLQDHLLQFGRIPILRMPILQWQSAP